MQQQALEGGWMSSDAQIDSNKIIASAISSLREQMS